MTICKNDREIMDCGINGQIRIHSAKWGRRNSDTCLGGWGSESKCSMSDYTLQIGQICNGISSCEVEADGSHFSYYKCFFNQPYAEIIYSCAQSKYTPYNNNLEPKVKVLIF